MKPRQVALLRQEWEGAIRHLGGNTEAVGDVFDDLVRRYGEPTRHYHTLDHVGHVLETIKTFSPLPLSLYFAIFLHDVIYDTHAAANEERSAEYAQCVLKRLGLSRELREETARLILLTKTHETTAEDARGQALLDADLSILGADEATYEAYAAAIRREYAWVSDDDYRAGRRKVLERFLARPRLYFTDWGFAQNEARARANLAREIARL
jgi:predicted metal-dependent HD superfamily phosphohydrolase